MQNAERGGGRADGRGWTFLSNHAQVLICIAREPEIRLRDIAQSVGITERAVQRIVSDLSDAGYVETERIGRRNRYAVNRNLRMRHSAQTNVDLGELLDLLTDTDPAR
jgi:DNA-binding MarR family transcriptional regulator